ncbi:MAG: exo-beta-N-acetylmuramidase NamZ domain-containing protein [Pseudomonadota bacterium]
MLTRFASVVLALLLFHLLVAAAFAQALNDAAQDLREAELASIAGIVEQEIQVSNLPGAVIVIGHQGKVVYRHAFGNRMLKPETLPMTEDTIFDIASLTKPVATATAVMQLVEQGRLRLDDPITKYWPEFKTNGKENISVRHALTHYSGLRAVLDVSKDWSGHDAAVKRVEAERPMLPPGSGFIYSDINFIALGELVRRVSGVPLDVYCAQNIFGPLGMRDTMFKPAPDLKPRIAPTEFRQGVLRWGEVHDTTAYRMDGVAGHAGLFSTAGDLSVFAQMLLDGGSMNGVRILSPLSVEKMTLPQTPPGKQTMRGFGWDIDSPFASNRGDLFPLGSYGHTGFTGTSMWIDPVSRSYVIVLTNRVHPDSKGTSVALQNKVATTVAAALGPLSAEQVLASRRSLTGYYELIRNLRQGMRNGKVETGIDVLAAQQFAPLVGMRVGLITNHSGVDNAGRRTIDALYQAPGVKLMAIFSPEHGLYGDVDEKVTSSVDTATTLPVFSLYGETQRPTDQMLENLDVLVFDIQDAGARFYTYITTMAYAMEAAASKGIAFYVLDRPNPITTSMVQGPVLEPELKSFTGYFPLPLRHGMTVGELAQMFNAENRLGVKLQVIKMRGYQRGDWYDETGLRWINPSPNLRTLAQAALYPGVAMVEGANISVGRGTDAPFELLGAPWVNGKELAGYLNKRKIQGVRFMPVDFRPGANRYQGELCHGVQIVLTDRQALDAGILGVEIASALYRLYPNDFQLDKILANIGARWVIEAIRNNQDVDAIALGWQDMLEEFRGVRGKYLLY